MVAFVICIVASMQLPQIMASPWELIMQQALITFANTLEKVCIDTVQSGKMTKDLALLIGPDQSWLSTTGFLDAIDANLQKAMS